MLSHALLVGLRDAFIAEATSVQRYTYFAELAEIEGHTELARLFEELAESIACAAHGHMDLLQLVSDPSTDRPIGDTSANVASALAGELREATDLYPALAAAAHGEGAADLASWLEAMRALKRAHVDKLERALGALSDGDA